MTTTRASASLAQLRGLKETVRQSIAHLQQITREIDGLALAVEADEARHQRDVAEAEGKLQSRLNMAVKAQQERDEALAAAREIPALRRRAEEAEGKLRTLQGALR